MVPRLHYVRMSLPRALALQRGSPQSVDNTVEPRPSVLGSLQPYRTYRRRGWAQPCAWKELLPVSLQLQEPHRQFAPSQAGYEGHFFSLIGRGGGEKMAAWETLMCSLFIQFPKLPIPLPWGYGQAAVREGSPGSLSWGRGEQAAGPGWQERQPVGTSGAGSPSCYSGSWTPFSTSEETQVCGDLRASSAGTEPGSSQPATAFL